MRAKKFDSPYICIEQSGEGYGVVYNSFGDYSVFLKIENPIIQFSGDKSLYEEFHSFYSNLLKLLGTGYILQKQDLFFRKKYHHECDNDDFLDNEYFKLFEGRKYTETETYLIITREAKKAFYTFDQEAWDQFKDNISRILQMFDSKGFFIHVLNEDECRSYISHYFAGDFSDNSLYLENFKATRKKFFIGDREVRVLSLVDIDNVDLPAKINSYRTEEYGDYPFSVDLFSFLPNLPDIDTLIYNQILFLM